VEFQFLIGTVKTIKKLENFKVEHEFQFLIGTVKTNEKQNKKRKRTNVSIPHRYCKNSNTYILFMIYFILFQFLIGTVKTEIG